MNVLEISFGLMRNGLGFIEFVSSSQGCDDDDALIYEMWVGYDSIHLFYLKLIWFNSTLEFFFSNVYSSCLSNFLAIVMILFSYNSCMDNWKTLEILQSLFIGYKWGCVY